MRARTLPGVAALVAVAAIVFGSATSATAAEGDAQEIYHVVQMGDSYSAGNGAGDYYGDPAAYRSHRSWAALYSDWLAGQPDLPVQFVSYAHSGAETSDILNTQLPQVSPDTDLVMFTIGGNDVGFSTIVENCFLVGYRSADGCRTSVNDAESDLPAVATATRQILDELAAKLSPDAQIVILGYPLLATDTPYILCDYHIACWGDYEYDAAAGVRQLGMDANALQTTVVSEYNTQSGVPQAIHVSDIHDLFAGHEPAPGDSNDYRWVDEFLETETVQDPPGFVAETDYSYSADKMTFWHPGITGHAQEALHLESELGLLPRALAIQAANGGAPADPPDADPPVAWLSGPFSRAVGDTVTFDASGSAAGGGRITQYEWDFDGDGSYDSTTLTPRVDHPYDDLADVDAGVRVTQTDGQTATASTRVLISSDGDYTAAPQDNCPDLYNYSQTDLDVDGIGDDCDPTPGLPTEDRPGLSFQGPDGQEQRVGVDTADPDAVPANSAGTSVNPDRNTVGAGAQVTVTATGFRPGDAVDVWIASDPVLLADATVASDGTVSATVTVPPDIPLGAHRLYVTAPATIASAAVTVVAADGSGGGELAASGGELAPWTLIAAAFAVFVGVVLRARSRRQV